MKKIISAITFLVISTVHAETCPSVKELSTNYFNNWRALNINNAEPLNPEELKIFKSEITKADFILAEWMPDAPEGKAHCYYAEKNSNSFLETYLVKNTLEPNLQAGKWWVTNIGIMKCNDNLTTCHFKENN